MYHFRLVGLVGFISSIDIVGFPSISSDSYSPQRRRGRRGLFFVQSGDVRRLYKSAHPFGSEKMIVFLAEGSEAFPLPASRQEKKTFFSVLSVSLR